MSGSPSFTETFRSKLASLDVSNVYLYVGDAVRWDALPDRLRERGATAKTAAASIHTPTSFPSITTGLHPPQHGIWDFSYRLDESVETLLHLDGFETGFANSLDEKFVDEPPQEFVLDKVLRTTICSMNDLASIDPPFVFMERGRGGHSPYGDFPENGWEYYRQHGAAPTEHYRADYREGVEMDVDHFETQLDSLADRGLREETLVIYTSDHGELLGEGGCLGHNEPIHPAHVYVPTVFIHPDIGRGEVTGLLRHVDLFPTIASVLGAPVGDGPGRDLTTDHLAEHAPAYYRRSVAEDVPGISGILEYESVWDEDGGHVFPRNGRANRSVIMLGKLLKSSKREYMRAHLPEVTSHYLTGATTYGEPALDGQAAREYLDEIRSLSQSVSEQGELDEAAQARLKELGYLS